MRRRAVTRLIGGAVGLWPLVAQAQQPAMPVIGFLRARHSSGASSHIRP